ncbi:MAG: hypothetical protein J5485_01190 [Candidatus Methanomethylophilaceae archaeon]|nr:hypothetical protein [Candidatus Methanomethylophilaceae archaeon]
MATKGKRVTAAKVKSAVKGGRTAKRRKPLESAKRTREGGQRPLGEGPAVHRGRVAGINCFEGDHSPLDCG